jgi:putative hydrolase of the HAD superfamily
MDARETGLLAMQTHRAKKAAMLATPSALDLFRHSVFSHLDWVIFDADNTLWDLEGLYHSARTKLIRFLVNLEFDADEIDQFQRNRDLELFKKYGRKPIRFPESFIDTLLHFKPAPSSAEVEYVWDIAHSVFNRHAKPYPGVEDALSLLSKHARIAILTAGSKEIQERRLRQFPYMQFIETWEVVEQKNAETFRQFLSVRHIEAYHSWMIGDSIRSDIIPARDVGLNTIFVETDNWSAIENHGLSSQEIADYSVKSVSEAVNLILDGLATVGRHGRQKNRV